MRQWRVGSFSMGAGLVLLGAALLVSLWEKGVALEMVLRSWPAFCILLGLEILASLFFSNQEQPVIRYDLFSMLITGAIVAGCIGLAALQSTGAMDRIRFQFLAVEQTLPLKEVSRPIPAEVKKIVVQSTGVKPVIDPVNIRELHVFGSYRTQRISGEAAPDGWATLREADAAQVTTVGDTMYVTLLEPPVQGGLGSYVSWPQVSVTVPDGVAVDLRGPWAQP